MSVNLSDRPARPRSTRLVPSYPVLLAVSALATCSCEPVHEPLFATQTACDDSANRAAISPLGLADARKAPAFRTPPSEPRFYGGIPSAYEPGIGIPDVDLRRIEPRIDHCVRAARSRRAIPKTLLEIRMHVRVDGSLSCVAVKTTPQRQDLETCIRELVRITRLEEPLVDVNRFVQWTVGSDPHVP